MERIRAIECMRLERAVNVMVIPALIQMETSLRSIFSRKGAKKTRKGKP
jgi:hypothetical protein